MILRDSISGRAGADPATSAMALGLLNEYSRSKRGFGGYLWRLSGPPHFAAVGQKAWWHIDFETGRLYRKAAYDSDSVLEAKLLLSTVKPFHPPSSRSKKALTAGGRFMAAASAAASAAVAAATSAVSGDGVAGRHRMWRSIAADRTPPAAFCFEVVCADARPDNRIVLQALSHEGYNVGGLATCTSHRVLTVSLTSLLATCGV